MAAAGTETNKAIADGVAGWVSIAPSQPAPPIVARETQPTACGGARQHAGARTELACRSPTSLRSSYSGSFEGLMLVSGADEAPDRGLDRRRRETKLD